MTGPVTTAAAAAVHSGIGLARIKDACESGAIPAIDVSSRPERRCWRITPDALSRWLAAGAPRATP